MLTHPHKDHYAGLIEVLSSPVIDTKKTIVYDGGKLLDEELYGHSFSSIDSTNTLNNRRRSEVPEIGDTAIKDKELTDETKVSFDKVNFKIFSVNANATKKNNEKNALSIAMRIDYSDFHYFTGGDLTSDIEKEIETDVGRVNVMKSNHHSSNTSNMPSFLEKLCPSQILISVGTRYGLPNVNVMNRFKKFNFIKAIYQTGVGATKENPTPSSPGLDDSKVIKNTGDIIILVEKIGDTNSPTTYKIFYKNKIHKISKD